MAARSATAAVRYIGQGWLRVRVAEPFLDICFSDNTPRRKDGPGSGHIGASHLCLFTSTPLPLLLTINRCLLDRTRYINWSCTVRTPRCHDRHWNDTPTHSSHSFPFLFPPFNSGRYITYLLDALLFCRYATNWWTDRCAHPSRDNRRTGHSGHHPISSHIGFIMHTGNYLTDTSLSFICFLATVLYGTNVIFSNRTLITCIIS